MKKRKYKNEFFHELPIRNGLPACPSCFKNVNIPQFPKIIQCTCGYIIELTRGASYHGMKDGKFKKTKDNIVKKKRKIYLPVGTRLKVKLKFKDDHNRKVKFIKTSRFQRKRRETCSQ